MTEQRLERLPEMTPKQFEAMCAFCKAWRTAKTPGERTLSPWRFGSTTISRLKKLGLIVKDGFYYRLSEAALRLMPDLLKP